MNKALIKIPLQFFGADAEDDDLYDDDLFDDEEVSDDEDGDADDADDADNADDADDADDADVADVADDATEDVIKELKAQGYVGNDLASLAADMKRRREEKEKKAAANERKNAMGEGKKHVRSGKPQQGAAGTGMEGFSQKDLREVAACLTKKGGDQSKRASAAIERSIRAIKSN